MIKNRLRRSMLFLNTQRAALVIDPFVYGPDCVILDLEDAVATSEKDSARIQLYHTLKEVDYRGVERWVRINGKETPWYKEDIRAAVAGGAEGIRMPMTESASDVKELVELIEEAEKDFGREVGSTMVMAAIESPLGVINSYEIATSTNRMMGVALSAGDFTRTMQAKRSDSGIELLTARQMILMAARAAGIMAFDTVYTDVDNIEGFKKETELIRDLGFDGKSLISPKQIKPAHEVFTPDSREINRAINVVQGVRDAAKDGVGVMVIDGEMIDIAHVQSAERTLMLAKEAGLYEGDLV